MDRYSITLGKPLPPAPPPPPPKPKSLQEKAEEFRSLPENEQTEVMQTLFGYDRETETLLENTFNRRNPFTPATRDAAVRDMAAMQGITIPQTQSATPEGIPGGQPRGETIVESETEPQSERAVPEEAPQSGPELSPEDILNIIDNGELPVSEVDRPRMPVYHEELVQVPPPSENSVFQQLRRMIGERLTSYVSAENTTETRDRIVEIIQRIMHEEGGEAIVAQVLGNNLMRYFPSSLTTSHVLQASPTPLRGIRLRGGVQEMPQGAVRALALNPPRIVPGERTPCVNAEIQQEAPFGPSTYEIEKLRGQMENLVTLDDAQDYPTEPEILDDGTMLPTEADLESLREEARNAASAVEGYPPEVNQSSEVPRPRMPVYQEQAPSETIPPEEILERVSQLDREKLRLMTRWYDIQPQTDESLINDDEIGSQQDPNIPDEIGSFISHDSTSGEIN